MEQHRQIILDTETTGLKPQDGHRLIEVGCIEVVGRQLTGNNYHQYINPQRLIDQGAFEVHGISNDFLANKPVFSDVANELHQYLKGAELVIHNAPFDVGFLNAEFKQAMPQAGRVEDFCSILDTLVLARKKHPGQRNSLDALCKRYHIDNSNRDLHGALLDADLLAKVYLAMSGGQTSLFSDPNASNEENISTNQPLSGRMAKLALSLPVIYASADDLSAHVEQLAEIAKESGNTLWKGE